MKPTLLHWQPCLPLRRSRLRYMGLAAFQATRSCVRNGPRSCCLVDEVRAGSLRSRVRVAAPKHVQRWAQANEPRESRFEDAAASITMRTQGLFSLTAMCNVLDNTASASRRLPGRAPNDMSVCRCLLPAHQITEDLQYSRTLCSCFRRSGCVLKMRGTIVLLKQGKAHRSCSLGRRETKSVSISR